MQMKPRRTSLLKIVDLSSPCNRLLDHNYKSCTAAESYKFQRNSISIPKGTNGGRSPGSSLSRGSQVSRLSPASPGSSMSPRLFDPNAKIVKLKCLGYSKNKVSSVQSMKPPKKDKLPKRKYARFREQIKLALAKYSHSSYIPEFSGKSQYIKLDDLWSLHPKQSAETQNNNSIRLKRRLGSIHTIQREFLNPNDFKKLTVKGKTKEISTVIDHYKKSNAFMNSSMKTSQHLKTPRISNKSNNVNSTFKPRLECHDYETISSEEPSFYIKARYLN